MQRYSITPLRLFHRLKCNTSRIYSPLFIYQARTNLSEKLKKDFPDYDYEMYKVIPKEAITWETKKKFKPKNMSLNYKDIPKPLLGFTFLFVFVPIGLPPLLLPFVNPALLTSSLINYSALLLAGSGFVHWGMAFGAYGEDKTEEIKESLKKIKQTSSNETEERTEETTDQTPSLNQEKTNIIDKSKFSTNGTIGWSRMFIGALPTFIALGALSANPMEAALMISLGWIGMCIYDISCTRMGYAPFWFGIYKIILTVVIIVSLVSGVMMYMNMKHLRNIVESE